MGGKIGYTVRTRCGWISVVQVPNHLCRCKGAATLLHCRVIYFSGIIIPPGSVGSQHKSENNCEKGRLDRKVGPFTLKRCKNGGGFKLLFWFCILIIYSICKFKSNGVPAIVARSHSALFGMATPFGWNLQSNIWK